MEKKLVYIDIGTHLGQEYKALFIYSVWAFLYRFIKLFIVSLIFRKNKKNSIGLFEAIRIIKNMKLIRRQKKNITTILVEPNTRLYGDEVYTHSDKVFCIAFGDEDDGMHFSNLFFPNSDKFSQGASIFNTNEDTGHYQSDIVVICGCIPFAEMLKDSLDSELGENSYELVIRINCEGSEDSVIYGFHKVFKNQFKLILGALKDVGELKGASEMEDLLSYIDNNELKFVPFSTLHTTWCNASREILKVL